MPGAGGARFQFHGAQAPGRPRPLGDPWGPGALVRGFGDSAAPKNLLRTETGQWRPIGPFLRAAAFPGEPDPDGAAIGSVFSEPSVKTGFLGAYIYAIFMVLITLKTGTRLLVCQHGGYYKFQRQPFNLRVQRRPRWYVQPEAERAWI